MFPIAEIPATDGEVFTDVKIELPQELLGHQMVCLYIEATIEEADQLFMLTGMSIEGDDTSAPSVSGFRGIIGGKGGITVRGLGGERILVSDMGHRLLFFAVSAFFCNFASPIQRDRDLLSQYN